jgi:uncharacterized RDD family membrane protein YckC
MDRGPAPIAPITKATEGRLNDRAGIGVVSYICIGLAALGAIYALSGLAGADPPALMKGLGMAVFWGLLAWGNEVLRERQRRRREE